MCDSIVDTRGTHELADDNSLCTIDNKCTCLCHQRKISHKDLMLVDLIIFLIIKPYSDLQRCRISCISLLTLIDRVLYIIFAECKIHKLQTQMTTVVSDRGNIVEYLFEAFIQKPLVGILLNFNEVGHLQYFFLPGIAHAEAFSGFDGTNSVFLH